jgi:hypothetical protein
MSRESKKRISIWVVSVAALCVGLAIAVERIGATLAPSDFAIPKNRMIDRNKATKDDPWGFGPLKRPKNSSE